ncbi:LOW QUALITY PROTEIN: CD160 antigen [Megaptera novaeangliae]
MHILSSTSQEGKQLCCLKKEEAEAGMVFLCKDKSDCSPETSLEQLRLKLDPGRDGISEISSQLVFTINQAMALDSETYQRCARSQKLDICLQGHYFSRVNYTVMVETGHPKFGHSKGALSSGFLQEKVWMMLVTSLVALQGMFRRAFSTPRNEGAIPLTS